MFFSIKCDILDTGQTDRNAMYEKGQKLYFSQKSKQI
jgi:hypothetical protein